MCNKKQSGILNKISIKLIKYYQTTFSPDHSPIWKKKYPYGYCKYFPTCSEYSKICFEKNYFLKAFLKSLWRIIRCNPWSKWWVDNP